MKRFKIGLAVLAALVTMSFTISSNSGMFAGTYSVAGTTCFQFVTYNGTEYDATQGDQLPDQTTAGLKTVTTLVDVDIDPSAGVILASGLSSSDITATRAR